ncbi:MAG TPA: alpha/beta fold hydrolase [Thermoleophilaceae bacterium]
MKQETDLEAMYRLFSWRITSNYVPHWDFAQMKAEISEWDEWCRVWSRYASRHAGLGDAAAADGDERAAGAHYVRAGLFYHWASFVFPHRPDDFRAALAGMGECWRRAAPFTEPPMELVDVPFDGTLLPGYLRKPAGVERPPVAVLVPGADSTKEELFNLSEHILERGVATFVFDGPGHGAVSFELKLRPDYEVPIGAVVDWLEQRDDLDTARLGVCGISYGGLFACRAAALDARVKAAVSMSSWYTPAGRFQNQDHISQVGLRQYMGEDPGAVQDAMTLEGVADKITVPLLQVYGGRDPASPPEHAYRVEAEAQGPTTTVVYEDGVHVCNNLWYEARPLVGHWLARALQPARSSPRS